LVVSTHRDTWSVVTIVPTSTSAQSARFRPEVTIAGRATRLLADQTRSIDTAYVVGDAVGYLGGTDMAQVDQALGRYLGLRVETEY
jgi:mRNA interferase MazF